jgi:uncharacterized protein (TIGR02145 family)
MLPAPKSLLILLSIFTIGACKTQDKVTQAVVSMPDGKDWTAKNIDIDVPGSTCYDNLPANCDRYGRLYTWEAATTVCAALGEGWRLASQEDWRDLAKQYGGVFADSISDGKGAFTALMDGGESKFNAVLGGGGGDNEFWRIDAHGFYWTATGVSDTSAWFANFGKGRPALYLQNDGGKSSAFAVRCVKDK